MKRFNTPHRGYPTPAYEEAPMRRRLTSVRLFGHPGAYVASAAESDMRWAGYGFAAPVGADPELTLPALRGGPPRSPIPRS